MTTTIHDHLTSALTRIHQTSRRVDAGEARRADLHDAVASAHAVLEASTYYGVEATEAESWNQAIAEALFEGATWIPGKGHDDTSLRLLEAVELAKGHDLPPRCLECDISITRDQLVEGMCPRCRHLSTESVDRLDDEELLDAQHLARCMDDTDRAYECAEEAGRRADDAADEAAECLVCRCCVLPEDEFCSAECYEAQMPSTGDVVKLHRSTLEPWRPVAVRAG